MNTICNRKHEKYESYCKKIGQVFFFLKQSHLSDELALSCAEMVWRDREEKKQLVFARKECYTSYHPDPWFTSALDITEEFSLATTEVSSGQVYDQDYLQRTSYRKGR